MSAFSRVLEQPEYVHTTINHFPLIGVIVALVVVVTGSLVRSKPATIVGLGLLVATSLSAWPVSEYGEAGFDRVLSMADEPGQAYLKYHAHLAHRWVFLYYLTAGVAALTALTSWKWPGALLPGSIVSVLVGVASLVAGIYIAQAGGEIRHREFRFGPAPQVEARGENSSSTAQLSSAREHGR